MSKVSLSTLSVIVASVVLVALIAFATGTLQLTGCNTSIVYLTRTVTSRVTERYFITVTQRVIETVTETKSVTSTVTVSVTVLPAFETTVTSTMLYVDDVTGFATYRCLGDGIMLLGRTMSVVRGYPKPFDFDYFVPCPAIVVLEKEGLETVFLSGTLTFEAAHAREVKLLKTINLKGEEEFSKNFLLVYPVTSTLIVKCEGHGVVVIGKDLEVGYPVRLVGVSGLEFQEPCPCLCPITKRGMITVLAMGSGTLSWG